MTRLRVAFATDVAQIWPRTIRFGRQFGGLSFFDVIFVRMLNQFHRRHERLATFLAHEFVACVPLIVQRKEMVGSVSA